MRVVIVDMQPITPAVGGGRLRLLGLFHDMGPGIEATYIGTYDWPGESNRDEQITPGLLEVCVPLSPAHHEAAQELSRRCDGKTVIDAAFSAQARLSPAWISRARAAIRNADVVVFSHPWAFTPLQDSLLPQQTVVYDSHNVEAVLKATLLGREGAARDVVKEVVRNEYALSRRADLVLCCSHGDMSTFARLYDVSWHKLRLVPNGAFTQVPPKDRLQVRAEARRVLGIPADRAVAVFVGSDYGPNVEAARFIAAKLAKQVPEVSFVVLGGSGNTIDPAIRAPNVLCTGVVDADRRDLILQAADVAVNPMTAGSGTNIKMFDFLAAGLPVVTTDIGARGICDESSAPSFIRIKPLNGFADAVRSMLENRGESAAEESPREYVSRLFSWERISRELGRQLQRAHAALNGGGARRRGLMFTTWNVTCGIAEHASYLADSLSEAGIDVLVLGNRLTGHSPRGFEKDLHYPVARPWTWDNLTWQHSGVDLDSVAAVLDRERPDFAIVQHHTAFMPTADYERLIDLLDSAGIPVFVEFHDARHLDAASLASFGRRARALLFHDAGEAERLEPGVSAEVMVAPLPVRAAHDRSCEHPQGEGPVIGGFGFLRPYKGVMTSIRVIARLAKKFPKARYMGWHAAYDAQSAQHLEECLADARRLGVSDRVTINPAFLPIDEVIAHLSGCDLVLLPYAPAGEGGSAAVNAALASGRVAVVSPSQIFSSVSAVVHVVEEDVPERYAGAIEALLSHPAQMQSLQAAVDAWVSEHSYKRMAHRLEQLLERTACPKAAHPRKCSTESQHPASF